MKSEADLLDKLRKVEALFAGAKTAGEKAAACQAADRIRASQAGRKPGVASRDTVQRARSVVAPTFLCALPPVRHQTVSLSADAAQSILVRSPRSFIDSVLWPEFQQLEPVLRN